MHTPTAHPLTRGQRDAVNLYIAWSIRLGRSLELIGPAAYEYWLLLEWDSHIRAFCERPIVLGELPERVLMPDFWVCPGGKVPHYISLVADDSITRFKDELPRPTFDLEEDPHTLNGTPRFWVSDKILRDSVIGLRNRKYLTPYAAEAAQRPDLPRRDAVRRLAKVRGSCSWLDFERSFDESMRHMVRCELAYLLHKGDLVVDLDTEFVSAHSIVAAK